jgi:hypothetical protein
MDSASELPPPPIVKRRKIAVNSKISRQRSISSTSSSPQYKSADQSGNSRKLSLQESYFPTSNPFIVGKKLSVALPEAINEEEEEEEDGGKSAIFQDAIFQAHHAEVRVDPVDLALKNRNWF